MKKFLILMMMLMLISTSCFAMTFSQPVEVGKFYTQIQRNSGFYMKGETSNNGTRFTKMAPYMDNYGYDKGVATFGKGKDILYVHYNYSSGSPTKFGDKNISNTVDISVWYSGVINQIKSDSNLILYSIRFEYCTSDLIIIGKRQDGRWIKYIDSKNISKLYFGNKDGYKEDGGVFYKQPICKGDTIIIPYCRWYWKGFSPDEGEIHLKWDNKAQWFGIEQVVY